jgi:hypothetical protein
MNTILKTRNAKVESENRNLKWEISRMRQKLKKNQISEAYYRNSLSNSTLETRNKGKLDLLESSFGKLFEESSKSQYSDLENEKTIPIILEGSQTRSSEIYQRRINNLEERYKELELSYSKYINSCLDMNGLKNLGFEDMGEKKLFLLRIKKLEGENEMLGERVGKLQKELSSTRLRLYKVDHQNKVLGRENEKLKKQNEDLRKENENFLEIVKKTTITWIDGSENMMKLEKDKLKVLYDNLSKCISFMKGSEDKPKIQIYKNDKLRFDKIAERVESSEKTKFMYLSNEEKEVANKLIKMENVKNHQKNEIESLKQDLFKANKMNQELIDKIQSFERERFSTQKLQQLEQMKKMLETKKGELNTVIEKFNESESKIKNNITSNNNAISKKFTEFENWKGNYNGKMESYNEYIEDRFQKMNETVEKKKKEYKDKVKKNFTKMKNELKLVEKQKEGVMEMNQEEDKFWKEFVGFLEKVKEKEIEVVKFKEEIGEGKKSFCIIIEGI